MVINNTFLLLLFHRYRNLFKVAKKFNEEGYNIYILLDGLSYNTRGYFASCAVFFRAQQGRGKMRAMSKMSAGII